MEVSLRLFYTSCTSLSHYSFNPCFNGSISETSYGKYLYSFKKDVSILVLMEVSLRLIYLLTIIIPYMSFNPCFNGSISETIYLGIVNSVLISFNPCFNGSISETMRSSTITRGIRIVSILVLMEVSLRLSKKGVKTLDEIKFQSLF